MLLWFKLFTLGSAKRVRAGSLGLLPMKPINFLFQIQMFLPNKARVLRSPGLKHYASSHLDWKKTSTHPKKFIISIMHHFLGHDGNVRRTVAV